MVIPSRPVEVERKPEEQRGQYLSMVSPSLTFCFLWEGSCFDPMLASPSSLRSLLPQRGASEISLETKREEGTESKSPEMCRSRQAPQNECRQGSILTGFFTSCVHIPHLKRFSMVSHSLRRTSRVEGVSGCLWPSVLCWKMKRKKNTNERHLAIRRGKQVLSRKERKEREGRCPEVEGGGSEDGFCLLDQKE